MAKKIKKAKKVGKTAAKVSPAQVQKESARLEEVDKELQARMDQPYVAGMTVHRLRFMEGEDVVVLVDGLYFRALVRHHYRLIPALYPHSNDIHFRIPTYTIRFDGFNQNNDAEIAENEVISRDGSDALAVFGMLYAHFWNEHQRKWQGKEEHEMGHGVWFMDQDVIQKLSDFWQAELHKPCSFADYCHPAFSPDKYIQPASEASTTSDGEDNPAA